MGEALTAGNTHPSGGHPRSQEAGRTGRPEAASALEWAAELSSKAEELR